MLTNAWVNLKSNKKVKEARLKKLHTGSTIYMDAERAKLQEWERDQSLPGSGMRKAFDCKKQHKAILRDDLTVLYPEYGGISYNSMDFSTLTRLYPSSD